MAGAIARIALYTAVVVLPSVVAFLLGKGSGGIVHEAAKSIALAGATILAIQVLLAARIRWIERTFGLDILLRFHKHMAVLAAALLLAHPILMAWSEGGWRLLIGLELPWYIYAGKAALILLVLNALSSLFRRTFRLNFERWRLVHDILGPAVVVLGFTHGWFAGSDLDTVPMKALWVVLLCVTVLVFVYHRFVRPMRRKSRSYEVVRVTPEVDDVHTLEMAPPGGEEIPDYLPGQFHFLTLYRGRGLPVEEHHFTISSSPTNKETISSTIKSLGDFTSTVSQTEAGDRAAVHGAFGRFSYALHPQERDLVFVAGGIGITPLVSMLRHMRDTRDDRKVVLLYANRDEARIVFRDELSEMESGDHPDLKVVHVLDSPGEAWEGETGFVDKDRIREHCGDVSGKVFYVCGPPGMAENVIADLHELDVPDRSIRREIFSLVD
jgi:predicted ferric reductase